MYHEQHQRLVIIQVPGWMGGIRLTVQLSGMLTAEKGLDFLFDEFRQSPSTRTYDAVWNAEGGFIIVRMPLRRKLAVEKQEEMR
jgi:hypothetical protein